MTRDELVAAYAAGRRDFTDLHTDDDVLDLPGLDLTDADFSGAFLVASFDNAVLVGARFANANIKTCTFVNADLTNAVFHGAGLCATDFSGAILDGARFAGAYYHSHQLTDDDKPPNWRDSDR